MLPLAVGLSYACPAQTSSRDVVAIAGGFDRAGQITLEWTLGELATETLVRPEGMLTQGFHQPVLMVSKGSAVPTDGPTVTVFPNPLQYELNVRITGPGSTSYVRLDLFDNQGRKVVEDLRDTQLDSHQLNVRPLPAGVYRLRVGSRDGASSQTFTVVKIQ